LDFLGDAWLNQQVSRLHSWAREGSIDQETAEMHINSFLGCKAYESEAGGLVRCLIIPVSDAPRFGELLASQKSSKPIFLPVFSMAGTLPDLWPFVCRALTPGGDETNLIVGLIRQVLPCMRKPYVMQEDAIGYPVLVNVVLGLFLGLYPSAARKPQFAVRAVLFRRVRAVMVGVGGEFVRANLGLVSLALMEYLARVLPLLMPVEEAFLREVYAMGHFFEHVPLARIRLGWRANSYFSDFFDFFVQVCDEFRSTLLGDEAWPDLNRRALELVEKAARVKRKPPKAQGGKKKLAAGVDWAAALHCPVVPAPSGEDLKILGLTYGIPVEALEHVHNMLVVGNLPGNFRRQQIEALAKQARARFFLSVFERVLNWFRTRSSFFGGF
jgi:hypothetical protein